MTPRERWLLLEQTEDGLVRWKPIKKDKDRLTKYIYCQAEKMEQSSFAMIPDQGDFEGHVELQSLHRWFDGAVAECKVEWDTFCDKHRAEPFQPRVIGPKIIKLYDTWIAKHGIRMILISNLDGDKDACFDKAKSLDEVDFRPYYTIYNRADSVGTDKTTMGTVVDGIRRSFFQNLSRLFGRDPSCELTEAVLIAWGTYPQPLHCDFVTFEDSVRGKPNSSTIRKAVERPEPKFWYGSAEYRFLSDDPDDEGPTLGWEPTESALGQQQHVEAIPQGFVAMFGPEFKHFGGVGRHPNIRLHVHFDNDRAPGPRRTNNLYIPESNRPVVSKQAGHHRRKTLTQKAIKPRLNQIYRTQLSLKTQT